jgi:hypothetical protein
VTDSPSPPPWDPTELAWLGLAPDSRAGQLEALAPIWATVELERALLDLDQPLERVASALDDPHLGARVVVMDIGDAAGPDRLALAEPSTEGRLAGALARHGERTAGRYVAVPFDLATVARRGAAAGIALSRPATGPFGRQVLVLGGPLGGPFLILVESPAVPSPP